MTRVVLALIAILLLALSAGMAHNPSRPSAPTSTTLRAIAPQQIGAATLDFTPSGSPAQAALQRATGEDAPAPALLAYLALVLIGSAVAVGIVRRGAGREI